MILAGILLLLLGGCSLIGDNGENPENLLRPWELVALSDAEGNNISLTEGEIHTARFSNDGSLGGETACNTYGGEFEADRDGDINITDLISTDIACEEPNHSEEFLNGLAEAESFSVDEGNLVLNYGQAGKIEFQERLE